MTMTDRLRGTRGLVALITSANLVASSWLPVIRAQAAQTAAPAAAQKPAAKPAQPPPPDGGWPRQYVTKNGVPFVVYQPQIASWDDQKKMTAYAAVAYSAQGASTTKPDLGTVKVEANTKVSTAERLVSFSDFKILEANFSTLKKEQTADIAKEITDGFPVEDRVIALDRVLASIDTSKVIPRNMEGIKADPPRIFFSKRPAALVNFDGDPIWSDVKGLDLKFAINTNWDVFQHTPTNTYYLRSDKSWMKTTDLMGGWVPVDNLPDSFKKLPADDNWKDVKEAVPGKKFSTSNAPTVFVNTTPAELILLKGEPAYETVQGTSLMWVSNTESDVFRVGKTGLIYYLVAGRWFSAPDFTGPWTFASLTLPEDFKKIPLEHDRSRVLASVPGSPQAAEGVLLASIPQTARVNKKTLQAPEVKYSGEPKFEPIEKTTVSHAVNTDKDIIKVGDLYYMCFQGVWFMGKGPEGPWEVTSKVPKEIYEIPVSSSASNVTYVTVEDDDDEWVTFAAAAMYTGVMVAWGCAVWGSGYYYPPYYYGGYYRPYYPTYGYGAYYNPWTGAYGRGYAAYGPYGGAGYGARYNPATGAYSRGAAAYGPGGARGYAEAYNPRTGTYANTRQGSNVYGSWGSTSVQRGDDWANTSRYTNNRTGNTTRVTQGSGGGSSVTRNTPGPGGGGVARTGSGDVYAGRDGNVYRNEGGGWQKYDNGGWNNVDTPNPQNRDAAGTNRAGQTGTAGTNRAGTTGSSSRPGVTGDSATMGQLNRDSSARSTGTQRTQDLGSVRSGSTSRSGSYRPSGGASRGGGGARRGRGNMPTPLVDGISPA
ncbi:MAG TPA: hypothetical protein VJN96_12405 [Vicinamibacterales bacterium]|nr:hypothetical protein [Vicinamibacterales bacterium]